MPKGRLLLVVITLLLMPATAPAQTSRPATRSVETTSLIRDLSANDWNTRQKAQDRLVQFGVPAIADLQAARQRTTDEEVRTRIDTALKQIEIKARTEPTLITLHVKDTPLPQVLAELSRQARIKIDVRDQPWGNRPPTVSIDAEFRPFWSVVAELCGQTQLLPAGDERDRVLLVRDDLHLRNNPFGKDLGTASGWFYVAPWSVVRDQRERVDLELIMCLDPKARLLEGGLKDEGFEAVDERGKKLRPVDHGYFFAPASISQSGLDVSFATPAGTGSKISTLKVTIRALVCTKLDRWEIPDILDAKPQPHKVASGTFALGLEQQKDGYELRLAIQPDPHIQLDGLDWLNMLSNGLHLLDENGHELSKGSSSQAPRNDTLYLGISFNHKPGETGRPKKLIIDIPLDPEEIRKSVELKDLPIPPGQ